jgi:hypothetical protein
MKFKVTTLGEPDYAAVDFQFDIYPEIIEVEFDTLEAALHYVSTRETWKYHINFDDRWNLRPTPRMS